MNFIFEALEKGNKIRVHGNGFLQLDLNSEARLHIWGDDRIPRQTVATPIHDHVFNFDSFIVKGAMINNIYRLHPGRNFKIYSSKLREGQDTMLVPNDDTIYDVELITSQLVKAGGWYNLNHSIFHESTTPEPTATIMFRSQPIVTDRTACVLVPSNQEPDNMFNRHGYSQIMLAEILADVLDFPNELRDQLNNLIS